MGCFRCTALVTATSVVVLALMCAFPLYSQNDDLAMKNAYQRIKKELEASGSSQPLPVMSFNIRLDAWESNPDNHFRKRVFRLAKTIDDLKPYLIGTQEGFGGQLHHLLSELPPSHPYEALGDYRRNHLELTHPARHDDFHCGILYDKEKLKLVEQDYIWLSKTPQVERSKDWNSMGIRTLNIARFKMDLELNIARFDLDLDEQLSQEKQQPSQKITVLAFNTHLDVKSEQARRHQSEIVINVVNEWRQKYPNALVFLFGDFNTCPGQEAHKILTTNRIAHEGFNDAWEVCHSSTHGDDEDDSCVSHNYAHSFHGWSGTLMNTYLGRAALFAAFTAHGLGLKLPHHLPSSAQELAKALYEAVSTPPEFSIFEAFPKWPWNRFHVDWILYLFPIARSSNGAATSSSSGAKQHESKGLSPVHNEIEEDTLIETALIQAQLEYVSVLDVRNKEFSSDHYPIVAIFNITTGRRN